MKSLKHNYKSPVYSQNLSYSQKDIRDDIKMSLKIWWKKFIFSRSSLCRDYRQQIRLSHENLYNLYKRTCDYSWKSLVSIYRPWTSLTIYHKDIWQSDRWSALDYYLSVDSQKDIFHQLKDLHTKVPKCSLNQISSENSEYSHNTFYTNNAYYSFWNESSSNILYCYENYEVHDSIDVWWSAHIQKSYNIHNCLNLYDCLYCRDSEECQGCLFCEQCLQCDSCIFCFGLVWKKYYIFNKACSRQEYQALKAGILSGYSSLEESKTKMKYFTLKFPKWHAIVSQNENATGNYIHNSKDISWSFNITDSEDISYSYECGRSKSIFDGSLVYDSERVYNSISVTGSYGIYCSKNVSDNSRDIFYCLDVRNSKNCAFCSWISWREYCILNKQYTKEAYERKLSEIFTHMEKKWILWEFIPAYISSFWYDECAAREYFPLKDWQNSDIFNWSDKKYPAPQVDKIISAEKLPDSIDDIPDDVLNWAVTCQDTWKPFRIVRQELDFYRKYQLPIPRRHPDQRRRDFVNNMPERKLLQRQCSHPQCAILNGKRVSFWTAYWESDYPEVFCETCYQSYKF